MPLASPYCRGCIGPGDDRGRGQPGATKQTTPAGGERDMIAVPDRTEAAEYYFTYIDQVPQGDICGLLDAQGNEVLNLLLGISEQQSLHRYAPGKWSIRDVVNHVSDAERLFVFRAFWFARGFESPLPSFDQTIAVSAARADDRAWRSLVEEFRAVRAATVA